MTLGTWFGILVNSKLETARKNNIRNLSKLIVNLDA